MALAKAHMQIPDVNKAMMDFLEIPEDQRHAISNIDVQIRPDAYPLITITQLMVVDNKQYTSVIDFELKPKIDDESKIERWTDIEYVFEGTYRQADFFYNHCANNLRIGCHIDNNNVQSFRDAKNKVITKRVNKDEYKQLEALAKVTIEQYPSK